MTNSYPSGSPGGPDTSIPSGVPSIAPRRSSYASVVSGAASTSYPRSGTLSHLLNQQGDYSYDPVYQSYGGQQRYDGRAADSDPAWNGSNQGRSGSWSRPGQLPNYSSAFRSLIKGPANGHGGNCGVHPDGFFVPSYLRGSRHVQKLEEAHRARSLHHKDGPSTGNSQPGSLSTSASSANLHTKAASHRGMTYDLIEKAPPAEEEGLSPLPTKWNTQDKNAGLEVLADGLEVKFASAKPDRDHEACAIRADHPMPSQCGIYYFEVTILSRKREESSIGIGFSSKDVSLARLPGWQPDSWAYHGDDGNTFCGINQGKTYGPPFSLDDTIGCGVNFRNGTAFFTKNGDRLGVAFRDVKGKKVYPTVGMKKSGEHVRVNFGQSPFVFDIDGMMAQEKTDIRNQVEASSVSNLAPPLSETELIQSLVVQYLTHEGYVESARAFAGEVHSEKQALNLDPNVVIPGFDIKQDEDAGHRQKIRAAVLEGDIEKALKHTNAYYPHVLKDNEHVYFRLRCRRFIEMIRQGAEMHRHSSSNGAKKSNGHNGDWYDDVLNHDMDLDDHQQPPSHTNSWDKMEVEEPIDRHTSYEQLLQETLIYGQNLQAEFREDPRREIRKALNDAFALLAYQDPLGEKEVAHHLDVSGRIAVAEELNSAILLSLGKSSSAALEQVIQQSTVLLEDLQDDGGPGAFVNVDDFVKPRARGFSFSF